MDKSHTEFLAEIRSEIERLKGAISALEEKLAACEAEAAVEAEVDIEMLEDDSAEIEIPAAPAEEAAADFTDFEIGAVEDLEDLPEAEPAAELAEPEAEAMPEPVVEPGPVPEPEAAPAAQPSADAPSGSTVVDQETVAESTDPRLHHSDTPAASEPEPEPEPVPAPKPKAKPALEGNYAWQQARPGVSVKHIRSGISLLDRAQFITILFKEDYALYDSTLAALESMESLDEATQYLMEQFPQWNYKSDIVFSFMMAVRKKLG